MTERENVAESTPDAPLRIALADIVIDPNLQPRQEIEPDQEWIERLIDVGSAHWPPIAVIEQDGSYLLIDGRHRYFGATKLKLKDIAAKVLLRPDDGDLRGLAYRLNRDHGKPLTRADMRAEAERLLCETKFTYREIARRSGLSDKTVKAIHDRLNPSAECPQLEKRIGRDGKARRSHPAKRATNRPQPSFAALRTLVSAMCDYLDTCARDHLDEAIVAAMENRPRSEWPRVADALALWGPKLTTAAHTLLGRMATTADDGLELPTSGASAASDDEPPAESIPADSDQPELPPDAAAA